MDGVDNEIRVKSGDVLKIVLVNRSGGRCVFDLGKVILVSDTMPFMRERPSVFMNNERGPEGVDTSTILEALRLENGMAILSRTIINSQDRYQEMKLVLATGNDLREFGRRGRGWSYER